jgi:hypothetical protein
MRLILAAKEVQIMASWRFAVPVLAACSMAAGSEAAEKNFTLTIEDKDYAAAPGDDVTVRLKSGEDITIKFRQSENSVFETDHFSFSHPAAVKVEVMNFDPTLTRYDGGTASGTHIIVERHEEVGDEDLIKVRDIFLNNMLAGPIASDARIARKDVTRKLHDGKEIKGVRAMSANADNDLVIAVYTLRLGKGALVFATLFNKAAAPDEGVIIDQFWDTLRVKAAAGD